MSVNTKENDNYAETGMRSDGIKDFITQTNLIGNVISAASSPNNSYEPLPFTNYSLFEENYGKLSSYKKNRCLSFNSYKSFIDCIDINSLKISVNPYAQDKHVFIPKTKV